MCWDRAWLAVQISDSASQAFPGSGGSEQLCVLSLVLWTNRNYSKSTPRKILWNSVQLHIKLEDGYIYVILPNIKSIRSSPSLLFSEMISFCDTPTATITTNWPFSLQSSWFTSGKVRLRLVNAHVVVFSLCWDVSFLNVLAFISMYSCFFLTVCSHILYFYLKPTNSWRRSTYSWTLFQLGWR